MLARVNFLLPLALALLASCSGQVGSTAPSFGTPSTPAASSPSTRSGAPLPLAGKVIVIDPGHQLGNGRFPAQIGRLVPDGNGGMKACNTTGTATRAGLPEATFAWDVAVDLKHQLETFGARVEMTRSSNSASLWGPCVDVRGRAGNGSADLKISIHGDGSYAIGAHGFHVIYRADAGYAARVRDALVAAGFVPATYVGREGLNQRSDLATVSLATIPTVLVELGNMKDAGDAAVMSSAAGRDRYAAALAQGIRAQLS